MCGNLYLVATPIGNLEDITLRALKVLKEVDLIVCEDTRISIKLLNHYGIKKKLLSNFKGNEKKRVSQIVNFLKEGKNVALISDAGTPLLSDPGSILLRKVFEEKIRVIPVPGPSALTAAISVCPFETKSFLFYGFFPKKESEKKKLFEDLNRIDCVFIFFETPLRIKETIKVLNESFKNREIFIAREMTKVFEEFKVNPSLEEIEEKGEYVLILSAKREKKEEVDNERLLKKYDDLLKKGLSHSEAVKKLSKDFKIPKNILYNSLLKKGD